MMNNIERKLAMGIPVAIEWIYFIYAADLNRVKIGLSYDPEQRMHVLGAQAPCEYTMLGVMKGDWYFEHELHVKFAQYRVFGEWFTYSSEIAEYVKANAIEYTGVVFLDASEYLRGLANE